LQSLFSESHQDNKEPERQQVSEELIEKSLEAWNKGASIALPDKTSSWAYRTRVLINDQLLKLPGANLFSLGWESVVYSERALLLESEDDQNWISLVDTYNNLQLYSNAFKALNQILGRYDKVEDTPRQILDVQVRSLANSGEYDKAESLIDKRIELRTDPWAKGVKAYISLYVGKYQDALNLFEKMPVTTKEDELWRGHHRALCYRLIGEPTLAENEFKKIWSKYDSGDNLNLEYYGYAAMNIGYYDEALQIYIKLLDDASKDRTDILCGLGICYLALGQLETGKEYYINGIAQAEYISQLSISRALELKSIGEVSVGKIFAPHISDIIENIKARVEERRQEIEQLSRSPEDEFKRVMSSPEAEIGWPKLGIEAGLARLHCLGGRWDQAAVKYQMLMLEPVSFPEWRIGFVHSIEQLRNTADQLLREKRFSEALNQLTRLIDLLVSSPDELERQQAELHCRLGYTHLFMSDIESAYKCFVRSFEAYNKANVTDSGIEVGRIGQSLLSGVEDYWNLMDVWESLKAYDHSSEAVSKELDRAARSLTGYLDRVFQLSLQSEITDKLSPIVLPVVVELGSNLIPEDTGQNWSLFKTYIPELRDRIQTDLGIKLPGFRFRSAGSLPSMAYRILLDEVLVAQGIMPIDSFYCLLPISDLQELGVPTSALTVMAHPLTGNPGCWINQEYRDSIAHLHYLDDPMRFLMLHLESVLLHNLTNFVGIDEAEELTLTWQQDDQSALIVKSHLSDTDSYLYLVLVLRSLVWERVPIIRWKDILQIIQRARLNGCNIMEAVQDVRLRIKELLPGNGASTLHYNLSQDWEKKIESWLQHENGEIVFKPLSEEVHNLHLYLESLITSNSKCNVLVLSNKKVRPFIHRLIEPKFPDLMILSQEEVSESKNLILKNSGKIEGGSGNV